MGSRPSGPQRRQGADGGERGDEVGGPGPGGREAEVSSSGAVGQAGGDVQEPVAQRLRLARLQGRGQREQAQPRGQVGGDRGGQRPGLVDGVLAGREPADAAVLGVADPALDAGVGAVPGFEERDLSGLGVGGDGLVAPAVGVFEQRQLRAGVGMFAADDDPHPGRTSPCSRGSPSAVIAGFTPSWHLDDRVPDLVGDGEPDRVLHGPATFGVQGGDPVQQVVRGSRAVGADQQLAPVRGRDLADGRGQDLDVIGCGVRAGVPGTQHQRQRLFGVVAPHPERVVAEALLERHCGTLLLGVRGHQGGVDVEDDRGAEVSVGDPRRRQAAAALELGPDVGADLSSGLLDPLGRCRGDLIQGPPHRWRRRDRSEDPALVAQHVDVGDRFTDEGRPACYSMGHDMGWGESVRFRSVLRGEPAVRLIILWRIWRAVLRASGGLLRPVQSIGAGTPLFGGDFEGRCRVNRAQAWREVLQRLPCDGDLSAVLGSADP